MNLDQVWAEMQEERIEEKNWVAFAKWELGGRKIGGRTHFGKIFPLNFGTWSKREPGGNSPKENKELAGGNTV